MKKCPYCAEEVQDEAVKCKHCQKSISEQVVQPVVKKKKRERSLGAKIGNVSGIIISLSGVSLVLSPKEGSDVGMGLFIIFWGLTITDFYVPFIRTKVPNRFIRPIRIGLPLGLFLGSVLLHQLV